MRSHDRRPRWREAILEPRKGMTDSCRVLLLKMSLSKEMKPNGIVSIPRARLAEELGIAPARVTERVQLARRLGFLDIVRRARPDVTAVYQATIPPSEVRNPYPDEVREPYPSEVRQTGPLPRYASRTSKPGFEVRPHPPQEVSHQPDASQTPVECEHETSAATRSEVSA